MQLIDMYLEFMFSTITVGQGKLSHKSTLVLPFTENYNLESVRYVVAYLIKLFQTNYKDTKTLTVFNFSIPHMHNLQIGRLTVHFEKRQLLMSLRYEPLPEEAALLVFLRGELGKAAPGFKIKIGKDNW